MVRDVIFQTGEKPVSPSCGALRPATQGTTLEAIACVEVPVLLSRIGPAATEACLAALASRGCCAEARVVLHC